MLSRTRVLCLAASAVAIAAVSTAFAAPATGAGTFSGDPLTAGLYIGGPAQGVPEGTILGIDIIIDNPDVHRPIIHAHVDASDNNADAVRTTTFDRIDGGGSAEVVFGYVPVCVDGSYSFTASLSANGNRMASTTVSGTCP